jgi:G3E family GTPase
VLDGLAGQPVSEILLGPHPRTARTPAPAMPPDHATAFSTVTLFQSGTMATADLEAALGGLPDGVWRIKGFVRVAEAAVPVLVQRVGRRLDMSPAPAPSGVEEALVLIGDSAVFRAASMLEPLGFAPASAAGLRLTRVAIGRR